MRSILLPIRRILDRAAVRVVRRHRARIDRFKLARRGFVRALLVADARLIAAVHEHARTTGESEEATWRRVDAYIREIVPFFNILAYYAIGHRVAGMLLRLFYEVTVEHEGALPGQRPGLPRDAITIYLMNHRSNADYVLVSYVLAGRVAISYAVGEWARAFPLEQLFKAFGSYFVRRRYREPLYHAVLERYVQLVTQRGVTQGIFLEGGLTRDGRLQAPKIGLLDYVLGIARDPAYRDRLFIVPVAVNYDRVLEDRSLLRERAAADGAARTTRIEQAREVLHYAGWNLLRLVVRRWKRYGRAAVVVGRPLRLAPWIVRHPELFDLPREARLALVRQLCDRVMDRIGALVPVTPVPLACAALQTFAGDFVSRDRLLARIEELCGVLETVTRRPLLDARTPDEILERALITLRMRRMVVPDGGGFAILPGNRPLVGYYANSIAHLLGPYADAVMARDALPVEQRSAHSPAAVVAL